MRVRSILAAGRAHLFQGSDPRSLVFRSRGRSWFDDEVSGVSEEGVPPRGIAAIRHHHHRHLARSGKERKEGYSNLQILSANSLGPLQ